MEEQQFGAWPKQVEVMTAVRDAKKNGITEIFMIGPIGSTKTFAMAMTHISIAYEFNNCIIPVGRKDLSEAQIGTWEVYMEALGKMGFVANRHYTVRQAPNDLRIKFFETNSIIQFIGMNKSRDRDWAKLKITATTAGIDEVDDVDEGGYVTLQSRTGRRNDNGAPSVTLSACNPNDGWTKRKIYLPWLKRIGRRPDNMTDEEWESIEPLPPHIMVIEFEMEDSPLYLTGYYDRFMDRPKSWKERFLYNNWNYFDDDNSLFKSRTLDTLTINRLKRGKKYIGVDPNAGGNDRAVICLWEDDTIVDIEVYTTEQLRKLAQPDEIEPLNTGAIIGRLTIAMAEREGVGYEYIGGDVVGIGQGWLTYMLGKGYKVKQFRSGDAPYQTLAEKSRNIKPPYNMLRSQVFHKWAMDTENSKAFMYSGCPFISELKKELLLHEYDESAKVLAVESKEQLKKRLGMSPDIADGAMVGYWVRMITSSQSTSNQTITVGGSYDELYNSNNWF